MTVGVKRKIAFGRHFTGPLDKQTDLLPNRHGTRSHFHSQEWATRQKVQ
jgi:hypothetical protein